MKIIIYALLGLLLIATANSLADDLVKVDSVNAFPGGVAVLPINFANDSQLDAIEVVLEYDTTYLTIDSFSTAGSRVEYINPANVIFSDSAEFLSIWAADLVEDSYIPIGDGLLANLYFTVDVAAAGLDYSIDSTRWPTIPIVERHTLYSAGGLSFIPEFIKGNISVLDAPPTNDSVWADSTGGLPGSQAEVLVYGKNEEAIREIDLSLTYSSDNILLNRIEFDGTRGAGAQQIVEANSGLRQIHINLDFGDASPLAAGSGPLAKIIFDISGAAPGELVLIDSVSYLGSTPMKFHEASSAGGASFAPYFKHGFVDIMIPTDVDDDKPSALPESYALYQNIPNPFNPATSISFDLPKASRVKLDVVNILGQKVFRLIDEELPAGNHTVTFDTSKKGYSLATGVYFYKLETDDFKQSRKMLLIK